MYLPLLVLKWYDYPWSVHDLKVGTHEWTHAVLVADTLVWLRGVRFPNLYQPIGVVGSPLRLAAWIGNIQLQSARVGFLINSLFMQCWWCAEYSEMRGHRHRCYVHVFFSQGGFNKWWVSCLSCVWNFQKPEWSGPDYQYRADMTWKVQDHLCIKWKHFYSSKTPPLTAYKPTRICIHR